MIQPFYTLNNIHTHIHTRVHTAIVILCPVCARGELCKLRISMTHFNFFFSLLESKFTVSRRCYNLFGHRWQEQLLTRTRTKTTSSAPVGDGWPVSTTAGPDYNRDAARLCLIVAVEGTMEGRKISSIPGEEQQQQRPLDLSHLSLEIFSRLPTGATHSIYAMKMPSRMVLPGH